MNDLALCLAEGQPTGAEAPELVHLLPAGPIRARDGRAWDAVDPARLIAASVRPGVDLVIDYEHQADAPERTAAGPVPAAG